MPSKLFHETHVDPYRDISSLYILNQGFIVWRLGTGENTELLHIRTFEKGKGYGRKLVYRMLDQLESNPPYYSIFGFTRTSNEEAHKFYGALGFNLQPIQGLYKDGTAIMFWQSFETLQQLKQDYENSLRS